MANKKFLDEDGLKTLVDNIKTEDGKKPSSVIIPYQILTLTTESTSSEIITALGGLENINKIKSMISSTTQVIGDIEILQHIPAESGMPSAIVKAPATITITANSSFTSIAIVAYLQTSIYEIALLENDSAWSCIESEIKGLNNDYAALTNKPSINDTTLSGNKTLDEFGIQAKLTQGNNIIIENNTISATQPTETDIINMGFTKNAGTVTSVNNVNPVNGNVTISIPAQLTETDISNMGFTKNTGTYSKPSGGIPNTDLANGSNYAVKNANNNFTSSQTITGNLTVNGNITQSGSTYESHAEKVFSKNDYIVLRDGATGGLASGSYTGLEAVKYDGSNNGRLAFDSTGTARVGDVGSEQPLLTRDETTSMTNGKFIKWDSSNVKAKTSDINISDVSGLQTELNKIPTLKLVALSQSEYTALTTKDTNTLYFIKG